MPPATFQPLPLTSRHWLAALVVATIGFGVFAPSIGHGFSTFDDPYYVVQNTHVLGGLDPDSVRWAFTTFHGSNWHPLTWVSLQLDASLWGTQSRGFHTTNVLLHAANAALVFLVLTGLTGAYWRSAAVALLFAVHPLRVESVAWITERKDVLSVFFGLLALWAWTAYIASPGVRRYLLVVLALALSLLAKAIFVTFPFLLLVLDWWPLRRAATRPADSETTPSDSSALPTSGGSAWPWLIGEKVPLVALVLASSAVTYVAQSWEGSVLDFVHMPIDARIKNAAVSYVAYLSKTFWPAGLAVYYPHRGDSLSATTAAAAVALLIALTAAAVALRHRAPYLLTGWLWYLGTMVPVIGLVQVGTQSMADRYTYFPQIGVAIAVCWGVADLLSRRTGVALAVTCAAALVLGSLTLKQQELWADPVTLWRHTVQVTGRSTTGLLSLARALEDKERGDGQALAESIALYREALELEPQSPLGHANLGGVLVRLGKPEEQQEAIDHLEKACHLAPYYAPAHGSLGYAYYQQGRNEDAIRELSLAVKQAPGLGLAHCQLGQALVTRGDLDDAIAHFREALRLLPGFTEAHKELADALLRKDASEGKGEHAEEALAHLQEAVRNNPRFAEAHLLFGKVLNARAEHRQRTKRPAQEVQADLAEAATHFAATVQFKPGVAEAWYLLGMAQAQFGQAEQAEQCLERAVELEPKSAIYRIGLARVLDAKAAQQADDAFWTDATATAQRALGLALSAGDRDLETKIRDQLKRLERREAPRASTTEQR
jgi:tetratricopeptide (TPR) repeat protein